MAWLSRRSRASAKSWSNPALRPALDYSAVATRNHHERGQHRHYAWQSGLARRVSGSARTLRTSDSHLRFCRRSIDRTPDPEITIAITHLREVLGDQTYESLARKGEMMTISAMATYAFDQIDQVRTELNAVSK